MGDTVRSVSRAMLIIDTLADEQTGHGLRLTDIVAQSGLQKTTVLRLLKTLIATGHVVAIDGEHYKIGFKLARIGKTADTSSDPMDYISGVVEELAAECGDSVYLSIRSGAHSVCINVASGDYPVRTSTLHKGDVRPLGVGAGSLAILAGLDPAERDRVLPVAGEAAEAWEGFNESELRALVDDTHDRGFAYNPCKIIPGVAGIGVAIRPNEKNASGAISIASVQDRMSQERLVELDKLLKSAVKKIESAWRLLVSESEELSLEQAQKFVV